MINPGIYDRITVDAYYADHLHDNTPTLNASILKKLIKQSPLHAWTAHPRLNPDWQPTADKKFDVGNAVHQIFLLHRPVGPVLETEFGSVQVINADSWRTNEAKEQRDIARAAGLVPLLSDQWSEVLAMLEALRRQLPKLDVSPPMFEDGAAEQTLIWTDRGVECRARLDWLHNDLKYVDDLKTTRGSAAPTQWANRTLWGMQAEIQAVFTMRGLKAACGVNSEFRFLVAETTPPYAISPVRLGPQAIEFANQQIDEGLDLWKRCLREDRWPSYPGRLVDADPPPWVLYEASDLEYTTEESAA